MNLKLLLRISLAALAVLAVTVGVFSAASADQDVAAISPAADQVGAVADLPVAVEARDQLRLIDEPTSTAVTPMSEATTQATCRSGYAWTCCSCGCGCRPSGISPLNWCKFYWCPPP